MDAIRGRLAGDLLSSRAQDPTLDAFLAKQPVVDYPILLDELEAEPKEPSFLQLAKGLVGKDFTQPISLPVELNEPMSDMMKRAEEIEYSELLDAAVKYPKGSVERLLRVVAYAISPYGAAHMERTGKPLFIVPGETVEVALPRKGIRYIAEAIQDNGWVAVAHAEGRGWQLSTDDQLKIRFGANSMEFIPRWFVEVQFDDGDTYTWQKPSTHVNQTLTQPIFVSHGPKMIVRQHSTSRTGVIKFGAIPLTAVTTKAKKAACRQLEGFITQDGKTLDRIKLHGFWDSHLDATFAGKATDRLWTRTPLPEGVNRFKMPAFTVGLCKLPASLRMSLPLTDSRNRLDRDLVELGRWREAGEEKARLEAIGQAEAKRAKENGNMLQPRWFEADPKRGEIATGEGIRWRYSRKYWAAKEENFAHANLPALFV